MRSYLLQSSPESCLLNLIISGFLKEYDASHRAMISAAILRVSDDQSAIWTSCISFTCCYTCRFLGPRPTHGTRNSGGGPRPQCLTSPPADSDAHPSPRTTGADDAKSLMVSQQSSGSTRAVCISLCSFNKYLLRTKHCVRHWGFKIKCLPSNCSRPNSGAGK